MKRHYTHLLHELLSLFPCVAIIGVRQCGKTTLLSELPRSWVKYDMEKGADYDIINQDPDLFFRLNPQHIAIDESQFLPALFPALRVAIDAERATPGRFIITGSSSPELLHSISESLAGRIAIIELSPFSAAEACSLPISNIYQLINERRAINEFSTLEQRIPLQQSSRYWMQGGYPEQWIKQDPKFSKFWMQNYIQTYLQRDILRLFPSLNQEKYRLFLQMLGHLSGSIINYSDIARTLDISQPTAREYFNIAHGTFIWRHIPAYSKNASKRVIKHAKGYLRDSGILHYLLHLNDMNSLLSHPQMGHTWEAMVIENLLRGFNALGIDCHYYHYRTGAGAEVDLILEGDFGLIPVEIKYGQNVKPNKLRSINDFIAEHQCAYGIVINNDEKIRFYNEKLVGIPFACL